MSMRTALFAPLLALAACGSEVGPPPLPTISELPVAEDLNPDPKILEINLRASEAMVELRPGVATKVMAYNERLPGALLLARVGDRVIVHFQNDLGEATTIHWHGLRISSDMDGSVMIQDPVPAGGSFTYDFVLPDAGRRSSLNQYREPSPFSKQAGTRRTTPLHPICVHPRSSAVQNSRAPLTPSPVPPPRISPSTRHAPSAKSRSA